MKKVLSLLLVLVLALGMSTTAFAAATGVVAGEGVWVGVPSGGASSGNGYYVDLEEGTLQSDGDKEWAGNKIWIPINEMENSDGTISPFPSVRDLERGKASVKATVKKGAAVYTSIGWATVGGFDDVGTDPDTATLPFLGGTKRACIEIELADPFVSIGDTDFDIVVTMYYSGKKSNDSWEIYGNYSNAVIEIDGDEVYADISEGHVVKALEYNKLCELNLGAGVSAWTKMFKDKKYYGYADDEDDEADDVVYKKYPDVDHMVKIKSVGLSSTVQYVTFDDQYDDTFYVYDANFKYLGRSNEKVAFSTKYYMANKMLDIEEEGDGEEPEDPSDDPEAPSTTGGDSYPANVNDNPGTGK